MNTGKMNTGKMNTGNIKIKKNETNFPNKNYHNNMVASNINSTVSNGNSNNKDLVKFYLYSDAVNLNNMNIDTKYTNIIDNTETFTNRTIINENTKEIDNKEPVVSYGLICFYKKKIFANNIDVYKNNYNKRTRKPQVGNRKNNYGNGNGNVPRIKILKRHETLSHTLKNMLGITGNNITCNEEYNEYNELETVVDVEEIIDMDNEFENISTANTVAVNENNSKEIDISKVILVQRRHTIGFIEFIRGKYDISNHDYIIRLFNMMTFDEKRLFREYDNFDIIRTIIGLKRDTNHKLEYDVSKQKFNELRNSNDGNMIFKLLDKSHTRWTTPEWGIPKGRRNYKEHEIDCAVREFVEETGIKNKHINVYRNVKPLEETYKGINGVIYKHIYYLASIKENDDARMNIDIIEKGGQINYEVSNVKIFSLHQCHKIIRPYYISKLNVIKKGFQLINSMEHYFE